jgi:hypothetical protein
LQKKSLSCGLKKQYILFQFAKKCLIDVDCTQKSSCWLQLSCQFLIKNSNCKNLWLIIFSPQDANMLGVFVPRARQEFDSTETTHQFYLNYAKMAGFSVRTMRTSKETKHWVCNRQGFMKSGKENEEPPTNKRSMRIGCLAYANV